MNLTEKIDELMEICAGVYEEEDIPNLLQDIAQWQREQCAEAYLHARDEQYGADEYAHDEEIAIHTAILNAGKEEE